MNMRTHDTYTACTHEASIAAGTTGVSLGSVKFAR